MEYELIIVDGRELLQTVAMTDHDTVPVLPVCDDILWLTETYPRSALLDQLREQIREQLNVGNDDRQMLKKVWIYVNFHSQITENDLKSFDRIFTEGFDLHFPDEDRPIRFVPLLASASQCKKFTYGFVREEIFAGIRERLDLGFDFEGQYNVFQMSYISKLYAYRGLYSSGAIPVIHGNDEEAGDLFSENKIIVLRDPGGSHEVDVYTADQHMDDDSDQVSLVSPGVARKKVSFSYLDGAGIITPEAAERFITGDECDSGIEGSSFQIRMPFLKGMLHTVDIRKFFRDMGVEADKAIVEDVFGAKRNLLEAEIIVTPSMFKLFGLLSSKDKKKDLMSRYFEMIKKFNHGLYVVKTEESFHNTSYVPLNSQLLNTLDLTAKDLDDIVRDHLDEADAFCAENLADPQKREELQRMRDKDDWMELLFREPTFLYDARIREMLKNHRVSRYNDIATGRIRVRGENRFLCGDLLYFLFTILMMLPEGQPVLSKNCRKLGKSLLNKAEIYLPGVGGIVKEVAMLRNPHLSRNEDVCVKVADENRCSYYKKYLAHLRGVVFAGHMSCIPAALGGADFDGDHVIISYDERIIRACKSGYVEKEKGDSDVPFVNIPTLQGNKRVTRHKYVISQVIYNSFSNRIGNISNAAMKIAAVEYDDTLPKCESTPSAAFCTILTGTEIDANKKGLRPDIDKIVGYKGKESRAHESIVADVETYIKIKKTLESWGGHIPTVKRGEDNAPAFVSVEGKTVKLKPNRDHNAVTQLLYRWADAFARIPKGSKEDERFNDITRLETIFPGESVFTDNIEKILIAYNNATAEFRKRYAYRREMREIRSRNDARIFMRLMSQYDDINGKMDEESVRYQMESLQGDMIALAEGHTVEEVETLRDRLFGRAEEGFDANEFWPYRRAVEDSALLREILERPGAALLKNFRYEGYRFLYYLLDNVVCYKKDVPPEAPDGRARNVYTDKYFGIAIDCYLNNSSAAGFEKELKKAVLDDMYEEVGWYTKTDLIQMIYPPKNNAQLDAFWGIFNTGDMLNALGGRGDVR